MWNSIKQWWNNKKPEETPAVPMGKTLDSRVVKDDHKTKLRKSFDVLGLKDSANLSEVRRAWKKALKGQHAAFYAQDIKVQEGASRTVEKINEAYETLSVALDKKPGPK